MLAADLPDEQRQDIARRHFESADDRLLVRRRSQACIALGAAVVVLAPKKYNSIAHWPW